jgi:Tfp pilus assembly major pilin PilA
MEVIIGDVIAITDLINEEFNKYEKINEACKFIKKHVGDYSSYVTEIQNAIKYYQRYIPDFQIAEVCMAYQNNLKSIAIKDYWKAKKIKLKADECLNIAKAVSTDYQKQKIDDLLCRLNKCIRSSSALEAKNSILRKFINSSSGQITQNHLNLISFYMNRKVSIR